MNRRETFRQLKAETIGAIVSKLVENNLTEVYMTDLDESTSPIVQENELDSNLTFTLDKIELTYKDGKPTLTFDASSSCENATYGTDDLSIDILIGIAEFLEDYEDELAEIGRENGIGTERRDAIGEHLEEILSNVFPDAHMRNEIIYMIIDDVCSDIQDTADWSEMERDEICLGDVDIALSRVLFNCVEKVYGGEEE